jgi:hypothetical protein
MSSEPLARPYPATEVVRRLAAAGSDLGEQLERSLDLPLRAYLAGLIPAPESSPNEHRVRLVGAVERYLNAHGDFDVDAVCDHLLRVPVMQQADHSNLLFDAETFLHNVVFFWAAHQGGAQIAIMNQCSTVSCLSRRVPVLGPTFLRTRSSLLRVFPIPKKHLKDSTFCFLPGPVTMTLDRLEGSCDVPNDPVLGPLIGRTFPDAPTAYRIVNDELWRSLDLDHSVRRVALDAAVYADVMAEHLEDPTSPVHRLLFDPAVRDTFLQTKRRLVDDPDNLVVNRAAPDFLWWRKGARLYQVVLVGEGDQAGWFIEATGAPMPVPYEPAVFAEALRTGILHPDRIITYLVRCLLPGVVAVGGVAQQDYVKLYRRMFLEAHAETPFLTADDVAQLERTDLSRLGGRALVEPTVESANFTRFLGPATPLHEFEAMSLDRTVGETIGELKAVRALLRKLDERDATAQLVPSQRKPGELS